MERSDPEELREEGEEKGSLGMSVGKPGLFFESVFLSNLVVLARHFASLCVTFRVKKGKQAMAVYADPLGADEARLLWDSSFENSEGQVLNREVGVAVG